MNIKAMVELEKVVQAISLTEKLFSLSLCGKRVKYVAQGMRVAIHELEDVYVYCFFNDDNFDVVISVDDVVVDGDVMSVNGILYEV